MHILAAWCERRRDFRHFRTDRIAALAELGARYPRRRRALLKEWRAGLGLPKPLSPCCGRHDSSVPPPVQPAPSTGRERAEKPSP
jgi:predicted DNA-binding transcriptional regulator YafY